MKIRHHLILQIIVFLLTLQLIIAQCPAQLDLKGLQAGSFQFNDLTPQDSQSSTDVIAFKQYTVSLKQPLQNAKILLALSQISALNSGIDLFDINIISKTSSQFTLGFIYQPSKWNKVSYRYLVNNRTDLYFQMITLNSASFKQSIDKTQIIAQASLDQSLVNSQKYQLLSFVRGIKYKNNQLVAHSLAISIIDQKFVDNKVIFNISVPVNPAKIELQLLSLSYLYFDPEQSSFSSFGGLISKTDYVGKSQVDILHADLPGNLYLLYGITTIDISSTKFQINSNVTNDSFFNFQASSLLKKIDFTYFYVSNKAAKVCQNCPDKIISGKSCIKDCNLDQIYYIFKDGAKGCQKCPQNQIADSQHAKCIQFSQYQQISTNVEKDASKQNKQVNDYQNGQSYTPTIPNQQQNSQQQNVVVTTSTKVQQNKNSQQIPILSTLPISGPLIYNPNLYQNQILTSPNENTNGNNGISSPPYRAPNEDYEQFTYCSTLQNSYWTGQSCQCKVGYKISLTSCEKINQTVDEVIQNNLIEGPHEQRPRPSKYMRNSLGIPYQPTTTQNPQSKVTTITQQPPESQNPTQPVQTPSNTNGEVICSLDKQFYNEQTQQCECIKGFGYKLNKQSEDSFACVDCLQFEGFYLDIGRCKYCGNNQIYNKDNKNCQCKQGFVFDTNQVCIAKKQTQIQTPTAQTTSINTPSNNPSTNTNISTSTSTTSTSTTSTTSTTTTNPIVPPPASSTNPLSPTNLITTTQPTPTTDASLPQTTTTLTVKQRDSSNTTNSSNMNSNSTQTTNQSSTTNAPSECMKIVKTPQINAANIYISLQLGSDKTFKSEDEMQNFIKQDFDANTIKPSSVYCIQNDSSLKEFDCLLLYPTGVPNTNFDVNFWYVDAGLANGKCNLKVQVNPLEAAAKSLRSLRRR